MSEISYTETGGDDLTVKTIPSPLTGYTLLAIVVAATIVALLLLILLVFGIVLLCRKCWCCKRGNLKVPVEDTEKADTHTNLLPQQGQTVSEMELEKLSKAPITNSNGQPYHQNGADHRKSEIKPHYEQVPLMIGDLPSPPEASDKTLGESLQRTNSWGNRNTSFRLNFDERAQVVEKYRRPNNNVIPEKNLASPESPEPLPGRMSLNYNQPLSVSTTGEGDIPPRRQMYSSPENTSESLQSPSTPSTVIFQPTLITAATPGGPQVEPIHVQTWQAEPQSPRRRSSEMSGPRSPRQSQLEEPGSPRSPKLRKSPLSPGSKQLPENLRLSINEAVVDKAAHRQSLGEEQKDLKPKGPLSPPPSLTPEPEDKTDSPAPIRTPQGGVRTSIPLPVLHHSNPATPQVNAEPAKKAVEKPKQPEFIFKAVPARIEAVAETPGAPRPESSVASPAGQAASSVRPAKLKIPPPTLPKPKNRPKSNRSSMSSETNHYDVPRIHPMSSQGTPMSETASSPSTPMTRQQFSNARGSISSRGSVTNSPAQSPSKAPWERPATKVAPWDRHPGHPGVPAKSASVKVRSPYGEPRPPMKKAVSIGANYTPTPLMQGSAQNSPRGSASGDNSTPTTPLNNHQQNQPKKVATVKPNSSIKHNSYSSFAEHLEGQPAASGNVKVTPPTINSDKSIKIATYIEEDKAQLK